VAVSRPSGLGGSPLLGGDPPVSFLMLLDPRFSQARQLMAGLDFAFPSSSKVRGTLGRKGCFVQIWRVYHVGNAGGIM
jgi:small ligand-binding sensory domain FIST